MYNMAARTGNGNTKPRSLRVPDDIWQAALSKAKREGTTLSAVVVAFLKDYAREG